jgi:hypothetical protein
MSDFFNDLYTDLIGWFVSIFDAVLGFLTDLPLIVLDGFLSAIVAIIESIPAPQFIQNGLQFYLSGIDPSILYFLSISGLDTAFALLGSGLAFRLLRKLVTLGQW